MKAEEYAAAGHLAAGLIDEVTHAVEGVHCAVLRRARGATQALVPASGLVFDAVALGSTGSYEAVRTFSRGLGHATAGAAMAFGPFEAPSATQSRRGTAVVAALGAAIGDRIAADPRTAPLAPPMALRAERRVLSPAAARAHVSASSDRPAGGGVALFVHGLAGHEAQWPAETIDALSAEGFACLHVRYTSGQPIHRSGAELADILGQLAPVATHEPSGRMGAGCGATDDGTSDSGAAAGGAECRDPAGGATGDAACPRHGSDHPDPALNHINDPFGSDRTHEPTRSPEPCGGAITALVLIGHSMGGLVIRSALSQAAEQPWTKLVQLVITLGTPHRGAPLEKIAAAGLRAAALLPETAPVAALGNQRASGIKDLRHGALLAEHWRGKDPDRTLRDTTSDTPLPRHVKHLAIVGHLGDGPRNWRTRLLGDGMVRTASAAGRGDPADRVEVLRLNNTGHLALLHHRAVTEAIVAAVRREHAS